MRVYEHRQPEASVMVWEYQKDATYYREQAGEYEEIADALKDLLLEVRDEQVKGSRLEGLYDEVTTSDPGIWNIVTAFIDVEDGEAIVTEESKLAQGKWAPEIVEGCDAMVTLEIQRGLMPDDFSYQVGRELTDEIDSLRKKAANARQQAAELEDEGDT